MSTAAQTSINDLELEFQCNLQKRKNALQKELGEVNEQLNTIEEGKANFFRERVNDKNKDFGPLIKSLREIKKKLHAPLDIEIDGMNFEVYFTVGLDAKLSLGYNCGSKLSENNPKLLKDFFQVEHSKWDALRKITVPIIKEETKDYVSRLNEELKTWKESYKTVVKNLKLASYMEKELLDDIIIAAEKE